DLGHSVLQNAVLNLSKKNLDEIRDLYFPEHYFSAMQHLIETGNAHVEIFLICKALVDRVYFSREALFDTINVLLQKSPHLFLNNPENEQFLLRQISKIAHNPDKQPLALIKTYQAMNPERFEEKIEELKAKISEEGSQDNIDSFMQGIKKLR